MKTHSPSSKIKSRKMHDQALVVADPWSAVVPIYPRRINSPVILVSDQYHTMASQLAQQYINADNSAGVEPVPKSFQINGLAGVRTPWCGGAGQPPCRSSVINAAPLGSCASPTTDMIFVSGAAFAFVRIHLESSVPLNATLRTVDGISLAKPIPVLMTPASPVELQPGQRVRIALCSDDPAAASAKPARIVIRAPLEQFGTVGECDQEILVPSSDRIRWKTRAQGRRWGGVGVGVEERRREREREIETPHFFLFPQLNDFFFSSFFPRCLFKSKKRKTPPPPDTDTNGLGLDGPPCTAQNLNNCSIVDTASAVLNFGRPYSQQTIEGDTLPFPGSLSLPFNGPTLESLVQSAVTQIKTGGRDIAGPTSAPPPGSFWWFF